MLAIGHPILGDRLYAHERALTVSNRLQLHAQMLEISHPVTNQVLVFSKECPFD
jgi:tRNA pseudouridine32 synthase/23S rRNA pseudouridine746 synthase